MYAYVRNNPTSLIDPSGAMYCDPNSAVVDKNGSTVGDSDCVSEQGSDLRFRSAAFQL